MSLETVFSLLNAAVLPAWLLLAVAPRWKLATHFIVPVLFPGLLALVYVVLVVGSFGEGGGSFSSLAGVSALFAQPAALLAGWVHYLAFDLFIGAWEVRDAGRVGIGHALVLPCLFFTLMLGPVGLGLYLALRALRGAPLLGADAASPS